MTRGADSRYSRQSRFAPLGPDGQQRIEAARVAVVGLGALGSVQAELLARADTGGPGDPVPNDLQDAC